MTKMKHKITKSLTTVHTYRGVLCIGDAHEIIDQIKKGDAGVNYFYDEGTESYINPAEKVLQTNKGFKVFSLDHHGGCWTQIFDHERKDGLTKALFIDTASAHLTHSFHKAEKNGSKAHIKLINQMIEKSMKNYDENSKDSKFWPGELYFNSGSLLFMGSGDEVSFNSVDPKIKIDYSKTKEEILDDLENLLFLPTCKFINFGTPYENYSLDFYVNELAFKGGDWTMYKIESLEKDVDWLASYYNEFYNDEGDLYKKKEVSTKDAVESKKKTDESSVGRILKRSLDKTKESMTEPEIERYKRHVKTYGYTLGYYLMHSSDLK